MTWVAWLSVAFPYVFVAAIFGVGWLCDRIRRVAVVSSLNSEEEG